MAVARAAGGFLDRARHLPGLRRIGGLQPLADGVGSLCQQLQIKMPRNGRAQADAGRKVLVVLGAIDQPREAALGELGAGIVDGVLHHLVIAAQHQHVGDRAAERLAIRDRQQMRLALVARRLDQRVVVEPVGLRQHRTRDLDDVVEGERPDRHRRRGVDRRQAVGEQRLGRGLDVQHQALEHVVEQADLLVGIIHRIVEKEIGDPAQRLDPARDGAVGKGGLQFVQQVLGGFGGLSNS